jgi:DNA mismatch endonuclease (patch repair protein)
MSKIKSKNTKPEVTLRKILHSKGFRYRLNNKLPGKPDILMPKYKLAIFVHGCFWHGHQNCKHFKLPKTRTKWWKLKLENNIIRDRTNELELELLGYKVYVVWECELKKGKLHKTVENLVNYINNIT